MRQPWEWQEDDIQALIREQLKENLQLEYKRSDSLGKTDGKRKEIAKDVSAMANSAGGTIVYGIDEQKSSNGPIQLDGGVDPQEVSTEWLEQVIGSSIQRRIDGVRVHPVMMSGTGRPVYVVWVPQSNRAPHMADHRYYKRLGTTTAVMEEYEVRDVGRRSESPNLHLELKASAGPLPGQVRLQPQIVNHSVEPVFYATCRLYIGVELKPLLRPNLGWSGLEDTEMLWDEREKLQFHVIRVHWSKFPILEGEQYLMDPILVDVGKDFRAATYPTWYNLGWELRAPRTTPKLQGHKLRVEHGSARIEDAFPLAHL